MAEDCILKDYQVVGLNWLALMYRRKLSCILADEMGLGKTCQVIALLSHLVERGNSGPHLVICPGSTLENWLREFPKFSPKLAVEPYYGNYRKEMFGI
jgi:SWI/SNF-related matrix-associated actin-dependent regulator 1 of chromatin subfamily A